LIVAPTYRRSAARPRSAACLRAIGSLWLLALAASSAGAQTSSLPSVVQFAQGFVAQAPSDKSYSQQNGLRLEVDSRWANNFGYRPMRVRILAEKPATAERRIKIRLYAGAWDWRAGTISVEQQFDLPLGDSSAETVVSCPQYVIGQRYWWQVWVDGVLDRELSVAQSAANQTVATGSGNSTNAGLKFLIVGPKSQSQRTINSGSDVFDALVLSIADLPTRWIDYSAIDAVAISPQNLQRLADTRPDVLAALRLWNRAGGQLWVNPVGDHWEQLADVERHLQLTPAGAGDGSMPIADVPRGWKPIDFRRKRGTTPVKFQHMPSGNVEEFSDPIRIAALKQDSDYLLLDEDQPDEPPVDSAQTSTDSAEWYIQRPNGLGYVRAFRREWDPVGFGISWRLLLGAASNDPSNMPTPLTVAMRTTQTWESRHGMTPDSANSDFADWLVPGVGLAPVTEFRVLITLFVLVIGPLNIWLLKRTDRRHLLILTVPLVALALTFGLFTYALLSDGLSTTVRVRSFTTLDQRTGDAACWARTSYYASLAPQDGLTFSNDLTLYPIIPGWNEAGFGAFLGTNRSITWTDDGQRLRGDWLLSRVPMQYLSIRARKSPCRLNLRFDNESMSATNELGARINFVAVVDEKGRVFVGDSIEDRASTVLEPTTHEIAIRKLRRLVADNEPLTPPALADDPTDFSRLQRRQQRRIFRSRFGLEYGEARLGNNLQSAAIDALVDDQGISVAELPPRTYFAVTETGPEVELGIAAADEEASFHVLVGNW
jgi:hypothetical protein